MPAGDVWGDSWGASWNGYWKQAVAAAPANDVAVTTAGSSYQYAPKTRQRIERERQRDDTRKEALRRRTVRALSSRGLLAPDQRAPVLEAINAEIDARYEARDTNAERRLFEDALFAHLIRLAQPAIAQALDDEETLFVLMAAA